MEIFKIDQLSALLSDKIEIANAIAISIASLAAAIYCWRAIKLMFLQADDDYQEDFRRQSEELYRDDNDPL